MSLLSDANILIDFAKVGGLESLARLATLEVLDVVLAEVDELCESQVSALGVRVVQVQEAWLSEAIVLRIKRAIDSRRIVPSLLSYQQLHAPFQRWTAAQGLCGGWGCRPRQPLGSA